MQIRHMEQHDPPVRLVAIGPVYRRDNLDLTHTPMFHQCEGLVVGPGITLAAPQGHAAGDGRGALRRRHAGALPSELLPLHRAQRRSGHRLHPLRRRRLPGVQAHRLDRDPRQRHGASGGLRGGRLRPGAVTGFAFGMGIERVAMLKWDVGDIRLFYENDLRFLGQFSR